jgi:hypothetical protein
MMPKNSISAHEGAKRKRLHPGLNLALHMSPVERSNNNIRNSKVQKLNIGWILFTLPT